MGHYTKEMQHQMNEIHDRIMVGYRAGVCDKDGYSEKDENGVFRAKPRTMKGNVTFHKVYPRHEN